MKTKRAFANALKALQRWQGILDRDREKLCAEYAKEHCPHKVGDITDSKCKRHFTKNGKVKIIEISGKVNRYGLQWVVYGEFIKPEPKGKTHIHWNEWDDEHFDTH